MGFPMGINCAPLVADLFLFCYERDFMMFLSGNKDAEVIEAFCSTSRYLDDPLNIDNKKGKQKSPGRATSRSRSQPLTPGGREKVRLKCA